MLLKSLKTLLGFSLLGFVVGVWIGCSSDASPVAPQPAGKTHLTLTSPTDSDGDGIPDADSTQTADSDGDGIPDADSTQTADSDGDGIPDTDSTPTYVTFADTSLERAVGEALVEALIFPQVPTSITVANMRSLTVLKANWRDIKSLAGLEYATNLDTLNLGGNSITALTPLSSLTNLKWLMMERNNITDVSPLSSLTNLEELYLYMNKISDVSPLASLTNLTRLMIGENEGISDMSPLASLPKLKWLKMRGAGIDDAELQTFEGLTNLTFLSLNGSPFTDIEPLTCLPNLEILRLVKVHNLNDVSKNTYIPYLRAKDVEVTLNWE